MMVEMPIARKMAVIFGAIIGLMVLTSGFSIYQSGRLSEEVATTERASRILRAMESYRSTLKETHKSVLRLVNSSEIRFLAAIEDDLAALEEERASLARIVPANGSAANIIGRIDELVDRWQGDILSRQLDDMRDPYTVDLARMREASARNAAIWEEVNSLFTRAMADQYARSDAARAKQGDELALLRMAAVGSAVVLLLMGIAMAAVMNRSVAAPLRELAAVTERLKDRQWDTQIPGTARGDELGRMARALEVFRDTGRRNEAVEAQQRADTQERIAAAEALTRAVDVFREGAESLLRQVDGAGASLGSAAHSLNEVVGTSHDYTRGVSQAAQATGESVQNVAAAIEEMTLSIRDISGQLQNVSHLTQRTADTSTEAGTKVTGLQSRSERINEVVDLINDIAGQINLLALNATIEAARAGEAGKGFAVVAQQVKQLADQTERATEDIGRVVGEVRGDVSEVVHAIRSIEDAIAEVNSASSAVAAAVEEQSTALDEISRNVTAVSSQTSEVAGNVRGVETKVEETCTVANNVQELSATLKDSSKRLGATIEDFIGKVANDTSAPSRTG